MWGSDVWQTEKQLKKIKRKGTAEAKRKKSDQPESELK